MEQEKKVKTDYNTPFYRDLQKFSQNSKNALKVCSVITEDHNKNNYHQDKEAQRIQYRLREILETTGDVDIAIQELRQYVEKQKKRWLLFRDVETGRYMFVKYKNRFSEAYITETRQKLRFLQKLPENYILHWTLTIPNSDIHSFIKEYHLLKKSFYKWMKEFQKLYWHKYHIKIKYVVTYETTVNEGQLHQHLHCIVLGIRYVPHIIFMQMKKLWQRLTGSKYDHLKIPHEKKDIFRYVMKYITKEISCENYTSMFLFIVKGKAFTMSESLSELFEASNLISQHKYTYVGIFIFDEDYNPLFILDRYNIDPANRTYLLSCCDPPLVQQWLEQYKKAMKEHEKMVEIEKKSEEMRSRVEYVKITKPAEEKIENTINIEEIYERMPIPHKPSYI